MLPETMSVKPRARGVGVSEGETAAWVNLEGLDLDP